MDGKRANLLLTDPPYGVSFKSASDLTIQNGSMKDEEFYQFLLSAFQRAADHMEKGGSAYVFHAYTEGLNFRRAFAGFHLAGCCIWVKDSLSSSAARTISGSTNPCCTVSFRTASIPGSLTASRPPSGTSPSPSATRTTPRASRSTCWASHRELHPGERHRGGYLRRLRLNDDGL